MAYHYHHPVDPDCPDVQDYFEMADDPMMRDSGCWGEFKADFEKAHIRECERCRMYGCENIEVVD